jgi:hypothetical protein
MTMDKIHQAPGAALSHRRVPKAGSRLVRSEQPDRDETDRVDPLAADGDNLIRAG